MMMVFLPLMNNKMQAGGDQNKSCWPLSQWVSSKGCLYLDSKASESYLLDFHECLRIGVFFLEPGYLGLSTF